MTSKGPPGRHLLLPLLLLLCAARVPTSTATRQIEAPDVYTGKHPSQRMSLVLAKLAAEQDAAEPLAKGLQDQEAEAVSAAGEVPADPLTGAVTPAVQPEDPLTAATAVSADPTSASAVPAETLTSEAAVDPAAAGPAASVSVAPANPLTADAEVPLPSVTEPSVVLPTDQSVVGGELEVPEIVDPAGVLPDGVAAATAVAAVKPAGCLYSYTETDIRPLRNMWNSSAGYCGESTLQMIMLARGVWISQNQARSLSQCKGDLILLGRGTAKCNAFTLARDTLAVDSPQNSYWDFSNGTNKPQQYVAWMKHQIAAGRPIVAAVRNKGLGDDREYDHIVPFWGVCSNNLNLTAPLNTVDGFSLSTDFGDEIFRGVGANSFYAARYGCQYGFVWGGGGCIPTGLYNYGLAVGQLNDTGRILIKTTKLVITGWASGYLANEEPGEPKLSTPRGQPTDTAKYKLSVWGLTSGSSYTTFRLPNRFNTVRNLATPTAADPAKIPTTAGALSALCTQRATIPNAALGCKKVTYVAPAGGAVEFNETSALGTFQANSLQYFLTVAGSV